jgi:hypothetical protein
LILILELILVLFVAICWADVAVCSIICPLVALT